MDKPIVVVGRLGWGNGDRTPSPSQLDVYGPGGRWGSRPSTNGNTRGDHLADVVVEAGAGEGDRLVVCVFPRFTTDTAIEDFVSKLSEWERF